jgi:hypothetical protein
MNHVLTQRPYGAGLAVDIASINSRAPWLVPTRMLRWLTHMNTTLFTSVGEAMAARAALDATPAITAHSRAALSCGDGVMVDGAGPRSLEWSHANGDLRARRDASPEHAEYFPIGAIRRAVEAKAVPAFVLEEVSAGQAHRIARDMDGLVGAMREGVVAVALRRGCDNAALGVIACARPVNPQADDGLTLEIRGVATLGGEPGIAQRLMRQVCRVAATQGYRRLVVRGVTARNLPASLLESGWDRFCIGDVESRVEAGAWWVKVLRVSEVGA